MMILQTAFLFASLVILLISPWADAFPGQAGDCPEGEAAVGGSHQRSGNSTMVTTTGSLDDGGFSVYIDNYRLSTDDKFTLVAGQPYDIALAANGGRTTFKGFLIRLGGGSSNIDTTDIFTIPSYMKEDIHVSEKCIEEYAVGGLTHMNPNPKNYVLSELVVEEETFDMIIDATVVIKNQGNESIYFYSQFLVDVIEDRETPEDEGGVPSASPTFDPSTDDPTTNIPATMDPSSTATLEDSLAPSSQAPSSSSPAPSSLRVRQTHSPTEEEVVEPPPPKDMVGRCGETASFGKLESKECYSVDTAYCTWSSESMACREISTRFTYYNGKWDPEEEQESDHGVWTNHTFYGQVTVYMDNCLGSNDCEVYVNNHACQATCDDEGGVTVESCNGLPDDSPLQFEYLPQTIDAAKNDDAFDMISTDPMCEHPASNSGVVVADRNGNGQTKSTKTMTFPTEMHLWFKDGVDDEDLNLSVAIRTELLMKSMDFFSTTLAADSNLKSAIQDVTMGQVRLTVADDDDDDDHDKVIVLNFDTILELDSSAPVTLRQVITKLANSDWNNYINVFREDSNPLPTNGGGTDNSSNNVLEKIQKVFYKGIGRAGRVR